MRYAKIRKVPAAMATSSTRINVNRLIDSPRFDISKTYLRKVGFGVL